MGFVHLHCHSPYSFLDGGSPLESLVKRAAVEEMPALALTDHHNVSGAVMFCQLAKRYGIKPIQGAELTLEGGEHLTVLAENSEGYANLCALITRSHLDHPRGQPRLSPVLLETYGNGLFVLSGCRKGAIPTLLLRGDYQAARQKALHYQACFNAHFFLEVTQSFLPGDYLLRDGLARLGQELGIELVATNNVHYAHKSEFRIHDLLTCVRLGISLEDVSGERHLNAENYLKSTQQMERQFLHHPRWIANTKRIAKACSPVFDFKKNRHPQMREEQGENAQTRLRRRVIRGARHRYGVVTPAIRERLDRELKIINRMGYADYFLLVEDVIRFARRKGIRYAGRGSAADSAVAYCLLITEVDAIERGLLFERFISPERGQKPDIDIDFDARRRDEVVDYVYRQYGEEHVAKVATFQTFRARSAIRDLGKVMGYSPDALDRLAKTVPGGSRASDVRKLVANLPEFQNVIAGHWEHFAPLLAAVERVAGFPRQIGTHGGGLIISGPPLQELTPVQRSAKGEWIGQFDKEGVEDLGLMKLDLLSLRTLSAIEDAFRQIREHTPGFSDDDIVLEDAATFSMIQKGETLGVFQLESPAQRALQTRLGADSLEDVIASVALIRPGPVKGNMVEPFIARRRGEEAVTYPHPKLEPILRKTHGVVLFQEQVIEMAMVIAGFTPGEADHLRRVMSSRKREDEMQGLGRLFIRKAVERGVEKKVAKTIYSYMESYASYGFCEAHAAAFGITAYKTAYLVRHYPAAFYAAILNCGPMGYYSANSICTEARRRGLIILPLDIHQSGARFRVEGGGIRIGLSQVKNIREEVVEQILQSRPFESFDDYLRRTRINRRVTEHLILSGAFKSLERNRRKLLWLLLGQSPPAELEDFSILEKLQWEQKTLGIAVGGHLMSYYRDGLREYVLTVAGAKAGRSGARVWIAGMPIGIHRPPTRSGKTVVFLSLEDETGLIDVTVFPQTYQTYGHILFNSNSVPLLIQGRLQRRGEGVSMIAERLRPLTVS